MSGKTSTAMGTSQPPSAYFLDHKEERVERHSLAVLVINEPGVLARVIGLFSGRGYNIESLTVAAVSEGDEMSRISIVTSGTPMIIEQIKNQLGRLVPVREVHDLTLEGRMVERELAMVKVLAKSQSHERRESLRIAEVFKAEVVDTTRDSFTYSLTGSSDKVSAFIDLMRSLGVTEVVRSGVAAISRGAKAIEV